mmetsp:Transcript_19751/g.62177  ORF Transcript_19751/g.62177 Transcript_19751/m.62177 type:complete len:313 (+) Transcript_19751:170-1108(+)
MRAKGRASVAVHTRRQCAGGYNGTKTGLSRSGGYVTSVYSVLRGGFLIEERLLLDKAVRDEIDAVGPGLVVVVLVPDADVDFADVAALEEEHEEARDSDAAADGERERAFEDGGVVRRGGEVGHAAMLELLAEGVGVDANAHGAEFVAVAGLGVLDDDVAVEVPVVVGRRADLLRSAAVGHGPAHADDKDGSPLVDGGRLAAVNGFVGPRGVELLGRDEGDLLGKRRLEAEVLGDHALAVFDDAPNRHDDALEELGRPLARVDAQLPVPLIGDVAVRDVALVALANARRLAEQAAADVKAVPLEHDALPIGQ